MTRVNTTHRTQLLFMAQIRMIMAAIVQLIEKRTRNVWNRAFSLETNDRHASGSKYAHNSNRIPQQIDWVTWNEKKKINECSHTRLTTRTHDVCGSTRAPTAVTFCNYAAPQRAMRSLSRRQMRSRKINFISLKMNCLGSLKIRIPIQ